MTDTTVPTYHPGVFVERVINIIFGIIEAALAVRIVLELLAANPASSFVAWVYSVTAGLLGPFAGSFTSIPLGNGSVVDVVALLAMIVYAIIGWIIFEVLSLTFGTKVRT